MKFVADAHARSTAFPPAAISPVVICATILFAVGIAARLAPLIDTDSRLFWQLMSEDGYLMQTIARNMAIGLGMSTAEGTMATNGVQPLATFLFAGLHYLAAGSKFLGILYVTLFSALTSATAAFFFYRVVRRLFTGLQLARELALLAAAAWFAAPLIIRHSMNGLETGVYYLAILVTLDYYLRITADETRALGWSRRLSLGVLLGLAFLARNDAVFFIGGLLFAHLALGGQGNGGGYRQRFSDCVTAGIISMLVSSPWLIYNYKYFGSIVPISGTAQSHGAALGQNLAYIPANLFENTFLYAPIPRAVETLAPGMAALIAILCIVFAVLSLLVKQGALTSRRFFLTGLVFGAGIAGYYGIFFGAAHFIPRYTSPLSIYLWPAAVAVAYTLLHVAVRSTVLIQRLVPAGAAVLIVAAATSFGWSNFYSSRPHLHKQVIDWVAGNVPAQQWVGAVQTGTLGYFHDRTINLDGKVNPEALRESLAKGHVFDYILASKINYVVDWPGIAAWVEDGRHPRFAKEFAILVKDKQQNLAVLRRIQPVEAD